MKRQVRILIVDDEETFRDLLVRRFQRKGFAVVGAGSGSEALERLEEEFFDVAIVDLKMPGMDGLELLEKIKETQPETQVLMLTGHGTIETAIRAMKLGAYDYLTKPCNLEELEILIEKAVEKRKLLGQNKGLQQALNRNLGFRRIIGESEKIRRLQEMVRKVAASPSPVLIEGESGTGKELIAEALHGWSPRAGRPFIVVNCGALPAHLLESELFGHEKGAFTGAVMQKKGLVEAADSGTLFLDEIGELDPQLQVKLLRFLETGEFRRVGDNRLRYVDVRVVAATNRRLEEEIRQGRFREDLYYRLNVFKLVVPPLRERKEDIPLLVDYFITKFAGEERKLRLDEEAMRALMAYDFPGNVRELAHMVERGVLLASGSVIKKEDLFNENNEAISVGMTLEEVEKRHIAATLRSVNGNRAKAARLLGISVRNLYRKIQAYNLDE
ncbi:sigma-54-dependent transcriptional regulator [Calderihabitans maritimus]|uniref:Stage 0 sporulation protein A homolog n=1 Tax=Calderihabitans maritimus TaxID=1246530 RepID=A0A1Z5HR53_9FIRM|nr:sigma-54 dependent transcriptional regulator [Calderihabitans maritimus]GAW92013.1 Fis family transcriptional regulator [Calderihabitans maritimus]